VKRNIWVLGAVIVISRDEGIAAKRFGVVGEGIGIVYTPDGTPVFFEDNNLENCFLDRIALALEKSGFWDEIPDRVACFDCELMPWSAKAQELLKTQYAAVGTTATVALKEAMSPDGANFAKDLILTEVYKTRQNNSISRIRY